MIIVFKNLYVIYYTSLRIQHEISDDFQDFRTNKQILLYLE